MFLFREARLDDEDAIVELAAHLDTLNLPPDRGFVRDLLARSTESFAGGREPGDFDPERRFLFVLEAPAELEGQGLGRVVGTSMIHAQHGTPREPHVFFRVDHEERYAELHMQRSGEEHRQVHMVHTMLTMGLTYQGPTEVGGLVLHPELRKHPEKLGRLLSLGRFVFMAMRRAWFRDRVLAELLPPLSRTLQGTRSPLWDSLGHRFTGLTYDEADELSRYDKEFIWKLFPVMPVHASLLPADVQDIIGRVGPETQGAKRLLESIGFSYSGRVDPFDGGPHFEVNTDEIVLVRDAQTLRPVILEEQALPRAASAIVACLADTCPRFSAVWTRALLPEADDDMDDEPGAATSAVQTGEVGLPTPVLARLGLLDDDGRPRADAQVTVARRPPKPQPERLTQPGTGIVPEPAP